MKLEGINYLPDLIDVNSFGSSFFRKKIKARFGRFLESHFFHYQISNFGRGIDQWHVRSYSNQSYYRIVCTLSTRYALNSPMHASDFERSPRWRHESL
jgi:hypothetical protein